MINQWILEEVVRTSLLAWLAYILALGVYNLCFHPLSKYPGPKLAALTRLWKAYIELVRRESMVQKLFELHAIYGDIVRLGPNELHFAKPSVYNEIYNPKNRWAKDRSLYQAFAEDVSSFTMLEYSEAKQRKDILLPLFSRRAIINMQELIIQRLNELCQAITHQSNAGEAIDILDCFRCFAMDTITTFCFARSMDCLKEPNFKAPLNIAMEEANEYHNTIKHFPAFKLLTKVPTSILTFLNPNMKGIVAFYKMITDQVALVVKHPETLQDAPHPTIYHELLREDVRHKIPSMASLRDEAFLLVAAGTDTVSNAATVGAINIIANKAIYDRLQAELREVWPNLEEHPRYEVLENIPYLSAVIKESLRLSQGVVSPMTRIVPKSGATLSGEYIPGGTIVAISNCFVHLDGSIFPDPHSFKPERWLTPGAEILDTFLVSFSKGPRSCMGLNLGKCELCLIFSNLFRRFDLHLDGVSPSDLRWAECYLPHYVGPPLTVRARPLSA